MQPRILAASLLLPMIFMTAATVVSAAPPAKVDVCHVDETGAFMVIHVAAKALPAHLGHGDGQPGGDVPGQPGARFTAGCGIVPPPSVIYDAFPEVFPGSFPSLGYEATSTDEFGDHIAFAGSERALERVELSLTDWACENDGLRDNDEACITTPGSSYSHDITLNLYAVDDSGGTPEPGALIASETRSFDIPYRPSWDSVNCTGAGETPGTDVPFGGRWYDPVLDACVHGYATTVAFEFDALELPDALIFGVAYDTGDHGANPIGVAGPYNSLNVSLATAPPSVGVDVEPGTLDWDTSYGPFYCDGGAGGTDSFRRDADCWDPYIPVIRFIAR